MHVDTLRSFCYSTRLATCAGSCKGEYPDRPCPKRNPQESKTVPKAYAHFESNAARGSKLDHGNSGGCMKRMRFAAVLCLACLALILFERLWERGLELNDFDRPRIMRTGLRRWTKLSRSRARRARSTFTASVGGDTAGGGVTWTFETKQSGCGGSGIDRRQLRHARPGNGQPFDFEIIFTAPAITATTVGNHRSQIRYR